MCLDLRGVFHVVSGILDSDSTSELPDIDDDLAPVFYQGTPKDLMSCGEPFRLHIQARDDPAKIECNLRGWAVADLTLVGPIPTQPELVCGLCLQKRPDVLAMLASLA